MLSFSVLLAITAVFLILLGLLPLSLCIQYLREGENDYIDLILLLHSIKIYKHRVYMVDFRLAPSEAAVHFKAAPGSKHYERQILKEIKLPDLKEFLRHISFWSDIYKTIKPVFSELRKKTVIDKFHWKTRIGFEDPVITGITVGIIWTIKGLLLSVAGQELRFIQPPLIKVIPDFKVSCFLLRFEIIITTKPVFLFSAIIRTLFILIAAGKLKKVIIMIRKLPDKRKISKTRNRSNI